MRAVVRLGKCEACRALEVLYDEPDGALLLDERVAAVDLLVAVLAALPTEPALRLRPDP
ncbi:MAG: hypothetical protein R2699_10680 [Acidimicrobiales bacterium]